MWLYIMGDSLRSSESRLHRKKPKPDDIVITLDGEVTAQVVAAFECAEPPYQGLIIEYEHDPKTGAVILRFGENDVRTIVRRGAVHIHCSLTGQFG